MTHRPFTPRPGYQSPQEVDLLRRQRILDSMVRSGHVAVNPDDPTARTCLRDGAVVRFHA